MAIQPVSDLVLDVARAADPAASRVAAARLGAAGLDTTAFAAALDRMAGTANLPFLDLGASGSDGPAVAADVALAPDPFEQRIRLGAASAGSAPILTPEQRFESFLVRTSVETMMASSPDELFGDRTAGPVWRSLLAEQIGDAVAARGSLGVAALLRRPGEGA
ncbi:rod-binding protein [Mongoliimonas terrestris]|uniref:rod-binding protein n=1 Tax=Mongoliimonas terrestris TaxID=1709001 RepID=UPI00094981ED|nr:rod-binding protein [Mongoliimonas terrestris]